MNKTLQFALTFLIVTTVLLSCDSEKAKNNTGSELKSAPASPYMETYLKKRNEVLQLSPKKMGLGIHVDTFVIYGIVLDWAIKENEYITLASFENGRVMLLSSNGKKEINMQHENLKNAVVPYHTLGRESLQYAKNTLNTDLPLPLGFKFTFLTNIGAAQTGDVINRIANETSPVKNLFNEANKLLAELMMTYTDHVENNK